MAKKILFAFITAGAIAIVPSLAHATTDDLAVDGGSAVIADASTVAQPDLLTNGTTPQATDDGCSSLPGRANTSSAGLLLGGALVAASLLLRRRA